MRNMHQFRLVLLPGNLEEFLFDLEIIFVVTIMVKSGACVLDEDGLIIQI